MSGTIDQTAQCVLNAPNTADPTIVIAAGIGDLGLGSPQLLGDRL